MKKRLLFILILTIIFIAACQAKDSPNTLPAENENNQVTDIKNSSSGTKENLSNSEVASHLATVAERVPDVNSAAAVIAGPYAVVGIDIDEKLDSSRAGSIKYSVTESLHHDPYGKTAVVVADADITERLRTMGNKIKQGHPVSGVVDELAEIVGRYMPEVPVKENESKEPDQNKESIPKDEQQELDEIQEEQSNPDQ
ncbi:MAG TPA: YhcN/YlaJ family sporulation lipoprotein [Virgibacillus sp.]|nr:YhcN/YlaJ family sporulation lipoprotein [Virgibacillus sp.]